MARHNKVNLYGQVLKPPKVYTSSAGEITSAAIGLKVIRRPYLTGKGQIVGGKLSPEAPLVHSNDAEMAKKMSDIEEGDMILVNGVLTTKEVIKNSICPCGHKNSVQGMQTYVTAINILKQASRLNKDEGLYGE